MFVIVRFKSALISRNLTTAAKRRRVPSIYKSLAIGEAQKAVTDYLHTTRSLSYSHAEHIATNASSSIRNLILNLDFSVATFSKSIRRHLRYHPINEFEFFFESIGIDLGEVGEYLPEKKFFFSEDPRVLEAACALSGFGFPWNKLGRLYREERSVFLQSGDVEDGGMGFDYRLSMAIPDKWIELLKTKQDEEWDMGNICHMLMNRRYDEKCIAYAESHDQAIVGDKTISMWLFDAEIYTNMSTLQQETMKVNRGKALHKMIRLLTIALGGEGYLNFMGNEFGHPEWIDFPRQGNGFSYTYCRRQWNLAEDKLLHYHYFNAFDTAMIELEEEFKWLSSHENYVSLKHQEDKIIAFERGGLLWVFNFHPSKSFDHYRIGTQWPYEHILIMDTDEARFGGQDRLRHGHEHAFPILKEPWHDRPNYIQVYIPSRTAAVFKPLKK